MLHGIGRLFEKYLIILLVCFIILFMSEPQSSNRFDKTVTLDYIRERVQQFAQERDWDQVTINYSFIIISSTLLEMFF